MMLNQVLITMSRYLNDNQINGTLPNWFNLTSLQRMSDISDGCVVPLLIAVLVTLTGIRSLELFLNGPI